jgi:hypothetical protein
MFDMTVLTPRYFELKLPGGKIIEVEPPKIKVLRKIMEMTAEAADDINQIACLSEGLAMALSKNKQGKKFEASWIEDNFNIDELHDLLISYFDWVKEIHSSKN